MLHQLLFLQKHIRGGLKSYRICVCTDYRFLNSSCAYTSIHRQMKVEYMYSCMYSKQMHHQLPFLQKHIHRCLKSNCIYRCMYIDSSIAAVPIQIYLDRLKSSICIAICTVHRCLKVTVSIGACIQIPQQQQCRYKYTLTDQSRLYSMYRCMYSTLMHPQLPFLQKHIHRCLKTDCIYRCMFILQIPQW